MLYDAYEKRIRRVASVKNFIVRFRIALSIILAISLAFTSFVLITKGNVTGNIELPPNIIYGEEFDPRASALFTKDVYFEYFDSTTNTWTTIQPDRAGTYEVRAVTKNAFGKTTYSDPQSFTIAKKDLTIVITDSQLLYGIYPTNYTYDGLIPGDKIEIIEFIYEDIKLDKTFANINYDTFKIVDTEGNDVTDSYNVICENKEISFGPIKLTITFNTCPKKV